MSEYDRQVNEKKVAAEVDCEVSVYEGSWATCDMGAEEEKEPHKGRTTKVE